MSFLTDLFNTRIFFGKRTVVLEYFGHSFMVYEKRATNNGRNSERITSLIIPEKKIVEYFDESGARYEDIIVVIHSNLYYRNILHFPFTDLKKIKAVVSGEVVEDLPVYLHEGSFITDFEIINERVVAYTIDENLISRILNVLGDYSKGLKMLIPYEVIIRNNFLDMVSSGRYVYIERNLSGIEIWGFNENKNVVSEFIIFRDDKIKYEQLKTVVMRVNKFIQPDRYTIIDEMGDSSDLIGELMEKAEIIEFKQSLEDNREVKKPFLYTESIEYKEIERKGVNLLKDRYLPKISRYLGLKDFIVLGSILFVLLGIILGRNYIEVSSLKDRVSKIDMMIQQLSDEVFGVKVDNVSEASKLRDEMKRRSDLLYKNMDRKLSALEIFKEFTSSLPVDVAIEYSDIMISREKILFLGKTRAFSDIDKIKEAIEMSDRFKTVKVINSGTTGSTGGFTVSFQIRIDVNVP